MNSNLLIRYVQTTQPSQWNVFTTILRRCVCIFIADFQANYNILIYKEKYWSFNFIGILFKYYFTSISINSIFDFIRAYNIYNLFNVNRIESFWKFDYFLFKRREEKKTYHRYVWYLICFPIIIIISIFLVFSLLLLLLHFDWNKKATEKNGWILSLFKFIEIGEIVSKCEIDFVLNARTRTSI